MRRFFRFLCVVLTPLCVAVQGAVGFYSRSVPSAYVVAAGGQLSLPPPLTAAAAKGQERATVSLLGMFPVKEVTVKEAGDMQVILGGGVFGMKLYTDGVLVVGFTDVDSPVGNRCPAAEAGLRMGDLIKTVDGTPVTARSEVAKLLEESGGRPVRVTVCRDGVTFPVTFTPVRSLTEDRYKAGLWVRDSSAGIGTVSFYLPKGRVLAGLGHPVCDPDTGGILPIQSGEALPARIYGVTKSVKGDAGEICGGFDGIPFGRLKENGVAGVYGVTDQPLQGELVTVASRQEVHTGAARLVCSLDNGPPQGYDILISRVRFGGGDQDMEITVTDPRLLSRTGGIVQGMSGSPILQEGKLVGAVTHVLVNEPERGYAIFAETMLATALSVGQAEELAAA